MVGIDPDLTIWYILCMILKKCSRCKQDKPLITEYYFLGRRGGEYLSHCKSCDKERTKQVRQRLRIELLTHYGNGKIECEICKESRIDVLDLDHIDGGGIQHRAQYSTTQSFYHDLRKQGFPKGLRVLCRNCNWIEWIKRKEEICNDR